MQTKFRTHTQVKGPQCLVRNFERDLSMWLNGGFGDSGEVKFFCAVYQVQS